MVVTYRGVAALNPRDRPAFLWRHSKRQRRDADERIQPKHAAAAAQSLLAAAAAEYSQAVVADVVAGNK